jgi:hypothetical protein
MVKPYFYDRIFNMNSLKSTYELSEKPKDEYYVVSTEYLGEECSDDDVFGESFFDQMEIERNDENLVKAVSDINPENLKIVEIPDDVKWYIHEYDNGVESVHEEHRIWS